MFPGKVTYSISEYEDDLYQLLFSTEKRPIVYPAVQVDLSPYYQEDGMIEYYSGYVF